MSGLSASVPKKVAFFVGLSENVGPVSEDTDVIFDRIVTNVGDCYSASSGRFTAPVNATYQFNIVVSAQGRQRVRRRQPSIGVTTREDYGGPPPPISAGTYRQIRPNGCTVGGLDQIEENAPD